MLLKIIAKWSLGETGILRRGLFRAVTDERLRVRALLGNMDRGDRQCPFSTSLTHSISKVPFAFVPETLKVLAELKTLKPFSGYKSPAPALVFTYFGLIAVDDLRVDYETVQKVLLLHSQ
jgi:hypothetical protein